MISTLRTSYTIGFSDALSPHVISGYQEMARWGFELKEEKKLKRAYLRGFSFGLKIKQEVLRECREMFLVAGKYTPDETYVATLRSSGFNN